jgi:uncharacterized protein (UPF0264 family)
VAKLLVSVRSSEEARAAIAGGAAIIDIKEPRCGALGRASPQTWRAVRAVVPPLLPLSAALGELNEWVEPAVARACAGTCSSLGFVKLGLSAAPADWRDRWRSVRDCLHEATAGRLSWVAVVYADWRAAGAPRPDDVLDEATQAHEFRGILVDTWDKHVPGGLGLNWEPFVNRVRSAGLFVALAGSLDCAAIARLAPLAPDIFAVRTAACLGEDRGGPIDPTRVADLARTATQVPAPSGGQGHALVGAIPAH